MSIKNVAVLEPGYANYDAEARILKPFGARIVAVGAGSDAVSSVKKLDPVALLVRERAVTRSLMNACPNLKIVLRYGVGVDNVDRDAAAERQIYVANIPDYGAENEVSEHALALYLAVQRRIAERDRQVRGGQWGVGQAAIVPNREAACLGLIGCGRIGQATARKFRAIGFERTLVFDPFLAVDDANAHGLELVGIDTLCAEADVVSLHAPLTADTRHILNAKRIALMKPDAIVVNVSRGGLVDEHALAQALHDRRIFGAGIDVFEQEPPAPDNPLLSATNALLSDHTAWYSERSVSVLQKKAAEEIARVLGGTPPKNWVNPW